MRKQPVGWLTCLLLLCPSAPEALQKRPDAEAKFCTLQSGCGSIPTMTT